MRLRAAFHCAQRERSVGAPLARGRPCFLSSSLARQINGGCRCPTRLGTARALSGRHSAERLVRGPRLWLAAVMRARAALQRAAPTGGGAAAENRPVRRRRRRCADGRPPSSVARRCARFDWQRSADGDGRRARRSALRRRSAAALSAAALHLCGRSAAPRAAERAALLPVTFLALLRGFQPPCDGLHRCEVGERGGWSGDERGRRGVSGAAARPRRAASRTRLPSISSHTISRNYSSSREQQAAPQKVG